VSRTLKQLSRIRSQRGQTPRTAAVSKVFKLNHHCAMRLGGAAVAVLALILSNVALHDHRSEIDAAVRATHRMVKAVVAYRDLGKTEPALPERFALRDIPPEYVYSAAVGTERFE
jgi:hypothetical protein